MNYGTGSGIIYQCKADRFSRRFWSILWRNLLVFILLAAFSILVMDRDEGIVVLAIIIGAAFLSVIIYSSYKRALRKITAISYKSGLVDFEIVEKDRPTGFVIPLSSIRATLKWEGKRWEVLTMSIYDGNKKVNDFYSGERRGENTLEEIVYRIHKLKQDGGVS